MKKGNEMTKDLSLKIVVVILGLTLFFCVGCSTTIIEPGNGETFTSGEEITFEGAGKDAWSRPVPDNQLVWFSDVSGRLGTGSSFVINDLSAGEHTITLQFPAFNEQSNLDSVSITVGGNSLDEGLIAYYPFNGNADDESGNGYHGTVYGGASISDLLTIGDNASDAVSIPATIMNGLTDITISAFIKINTIHTGGTTYPRNTLIHGARSGSDENVFDVCWDHETNWHFRAYDTIPNFEDSSVSDKLWHHVVALREGNIARIYIDGIEVEDGNTVETTAFSIASGGLVIGQEQDCAGGCYNRNQSFAGEIDDFRIYNRALSEAEIKALQNLSE